MRNPDFNNTDAAGIVATLLEQIAANTSSAGPGESAPVRQMSIVEFTEELLKQVARNKRS